MRDRLSALLEAFDALRPADTPFDYPRSATFGLGEHDTHLVFGAMVHGDEVGSLPAVVAVMRALHADPTLCRGKVTFFVGNPEAGLADTRFLESDLNRVFTDDPPDTHEGRRATEIRPILDAADVFIDLHQTILDTRQAFYIAPFQVQGWHWARALRAAEVWVTRHPGASFSSGTCCADEYVRLRGKPAITIELSRKGFVEDAAAKAGAAIRDALALSDAVAAGETTLAEAAARQEDVVCYETVHREPFHPDTLALREGLVNFQPVTEGEVLTAEGSPVRTAPCDGMVLFPKFPPVVDGAYKRPLPKEIFRVIAPLAEHPTVAYADAL